MVMFLKKVSVLHLITYTVKNIFIICNHNIFLFFIFQIYVVQIT